MKRICEIISVLLVISNFVLLLSCSGIIKGGSYSGPGANGREKSIPDGYPDDFVYVAGVVSRPPASPPPLRPEPGIPFFEPDFGTIVVRLSDAVLEGNGRVLNGYAKYSPENADATLALLSSNNGYLLYDVDRSSPDKYSFIKKTSLKYTNGENRWDGNDPDTLYFTDKMKFCKYSASTDSSTVIRDFSSDYPNGTKTYFDEEGDSSADSRYWAWFVVEDGKKARVFSYDKDAEANGLADTDGKPGEIIGFLSHDDFQTRHSDGANWISVTDSGKKIVIGSSYGDWTSGSYNIDFSGGISLHVWPGHSDTAIDADGKEVLFGFDFLGDGWGMVDLTTGAKTRLLRRPWPDPNDWTGASYGLATGTGSLAKPGWGLYSAYGTNCNVGNKFDCSLIYMMRLKDVGHNENSENIPQVWQIAHSYSSGCYQAQPNAVINRAGTRIYFTSRWKYEDECTSDDTYDVYIIELPDNWDKELLKY